MQGHTKLIKRDNDDILNAENSHYRNKVHFRKYILKLKNLIALIIHNITVLLYIYLI